VKSIRPVPSRFAVGKKVKVKGYLHEGVRTIRAHIADIEGGVRLDKGVDDGFFGSWNIDALISEDELELTASYTKSLREHEALAKKVEAYFMPLVKKALRQKDFDEAKSLLDRCPDHVVKCFITDQIAVARGDYDKPGGYDKNGKKRP